MSLKNGEIVSITINLQNFRKISVSYVVWSMEMSLTEIELGPILFLGI
jgi:glutamate formiminotransferase